MSNPARQVVSAVAAALLVACGGSDPGDATAPSAAKTTSVGAGAHAVDPASAGGTSFLAQPSPAIRAGAATTQEAIEQALAAYTGNPQR